MRGKAVDKTTIFIKGCCCCCCYSIGSGEEDVEGKKVTKEVELSHSSEATADATLTEPKEEPASGECQTREVTPPTPLAVSSASALVDDPNLQLASTPKSPSNEGKDEATGMPSQDKDRSFKVSSEGDETTEEDKRKNNKDIEQVSTITNVLSHEVVPQMTVCTMDCPLYCIVVIGYLIILGRIGGENEG